MKKITPLALFAIIFFAVLLAIVVVCAGINWFITPKPYSPEPSSNTSR